jgi:hypothetical protein
MPADGAERVPETLIYLNIGHNWWPKRILLKDFLAI